MSETPPPPPPPAAAAPGAPLTADQDKLWASLAHLGGILYILPSLIIWLVFKDRGARTNVEGKEALNWQITFLIVQVAIWIIVAILTSVFLFTPGLWALIGIIAWIPWITWVVNVIFSILGFVKVNGGGSYRYPFNFRFIK